jgi:hypothetical protein
MPFGHATLATAAASGMTAVSNRYGSRIRRRPRDSQRSLPDTSRTKPETITGNIGPMMAPGGGVQGDWKPHHRNEADQQQRTQSDGPRRLGRHRVGIDPARHSPASAAGRYFGAALRSTLPIFLIPSRSRTAMT